MVKASHKPMYPSKAIVKNENVIFEDSQEGFGQEKHFDEVSSTPTSRL
jgi:hypothetical protein